LRRGADVNVKTNDDNTPLSVAIQNSHKEALKKV
jgi:ankyrin repeat protein